MLLALKCTLEPFSERTYVLVGKSGWRPLFAFEMERNDSLQAEWNRARWRLCANGRTEAFFVTIF